MNMNQTGAIVGRAGGSGLEQRAWRLNPDPAPTTEGAGLAPGW
jgi:hypothetical protein